MSYAVFFGVLSATCLIGALAALWASLRSAFGGEGGATIATAADAPERAALLDEKTSLLRAIKDLSYEHQVGKLDKADFERLDRAYRARAKEVLELLDRDVEPYRVRAEKLLDAAAPLGAPGVGSDARAKPGKGAKPKKQSKATRTPGDVAGPASPETETSTAAPSSEALLGKIEALAPEKRAAAEAFLAKLAAGESQDERESEDESDSGPQPSTTREPLADHEPPMASRRAATRTEASEGARDAEDEPDEERS